MKVVSLGIAALMIISASVEAQPFQDRPITEGLYGFTAYPLNRGGVRIGNLTFPFHLSQLQWIYIDYGLTEDLQIGSALPANFLGNLNLLGKFRFLQLPLGIELAIPFSIDLTLRPARRMVLGSGLILSWAMEGLSYHSGLWLSFSKEERLKPSIFYVIIDLDPLPDTKLLIELDVYPKADNPLLIRLGELRRLSPLNLRVTATLVLPEGSNTLDAALFLRF